MGNIENVKSNFHIDHLNFNDEHGLKAIHWACLCSNIMILEWMLQNNCDIEVSCENGWRPIHFASFMGYEKMVQFLIKKFCDLDCQTKNGETILQVANGDCKHDFIDEILNDNINLKIGLSMGLECGDYCDHGFCLRSVIQCKFNEIEQIGLGRFAIIQKVTDSQSYQQFAVKKVKRYYYDSFANPECVLPIINEILPNLNHPKIVKLFGMIKTETEMILFMELMNNGTLQDEIRSNGVLKDEKIARYCKDILQAVAFLHGNKILHGFINPTNILMDNNYGCKLAISIFSCSLADGDVQVSENLLRTDYLYNISDAYEIMNNKPLSYSYDILGIGYTVINMIAERNLRYQLNINTKFEEIKSKISNDMKSFVQGMIKINPSERAKASDLLGYDFIRNVSIDNSYNNQTKMDNSNINRNNVKEIIQNAINNKQIGQSMGLKCEKGCRHNFCLSSVTATNFKKGKNIGEGYCGKIYKINEVDWAMKIIKNINDENIKEQKKYFENDINRYRYIINHENIVKYFGAVNNLNKIFIFMEFIDGEPLSLKIKRNKFNRLPLRTIKQYTKQILKGLKFLHNSNIIHRDIKSSNILINKSEIVKIADFGLSRFLKTISKHQKKTFCGTVNYMSPEVINDEPYNCSADIWSLGATVFEMATGHPPYHSLTESAVLFKIGNTRKIEYPPDILNDTKIFLNLMINANSKNRSSAESLLCCEFLN